MIALIDVNTFYASCEQVFRPDLQGKPVIVLSNNDGCIIAANREAKALGIPMWKPVFENEALLKKHKVEVFSTNFTLYGDMSNRVMNTLRTFTPEMEIYSIDEAFLNLAGMNVDQNVYAKEIRARVLQWCGLAVGVGVAPTKCLAKVANKIAKKFQDETEGTHVIDSEEKRIKALRWIPVGDIWGIGRRHSKRLNKLGIHTGWDFVNLSDSWVKKNMSVVGLRLKHDLEGKPCLGIHEIPDPKKTICTQKSFGNNLDDYSLISEALSYYVAECTEKLRKQHSMASHVSVWIETNPFRKDHPQYRNSITLALNTPTESTLTLTGYAQAGLRAIFKEGYKYKRVGVMLTTLTPHTSYQLNLFENENPEQTKRLMLAMDSINFKYGKATLRTASAGFRRKEWKHRQELLSPRYTTCFDEIMKVGSNP